MAHGVYRSTAIDLQQYENNYIYHVSVTYTIESVLWNKQQTMHDIQIYDDDDDIDDRKRYMDVHVVFS